MKIEIYTRSMNVDLYRLSQSTINLPYPRRRRLFTSADGYFFDDIMRSKADFIINIDEDAFIVDNEKLKNLLEYVLDHNYINCGVPDGGVIEIRKHNPLITNPFFNILNVAEIRKKFKVNDIVRNYSVHKKEFEKFAPMHLMRSIYEFDFYEPYSPFFIWLATNFKTLYLDADEHNDKISTVVKDHLGQPFLLHSWYSRVYGKDDQQTRRINNLIKEAKPDIHADKFLSAVGSAERLQRACETFGNKYIYPLKYRWERKKWY